MMLLTDVKHVKYQNKFYDSVLLRHLHQFHDGHSWTPWNEMQDQMPGISQCISNWSFIQTYHVCPQHSQRHTEIIDLLQL